MSTMIDVIILFNNCTLF